MPTKKGVKKGGAPRGNKNHARGPRIGRQNKPTTGKTSALPLPQPRPGAKIPRAAKHPKAGGKDFVKGQNSHTGVVFQRGEDMLPRGNTLLMYKIIFHDARKDLYDSIRIGIRKSPAMAHAFLNDITDRMHGTATRKSETTVHREPTFVFTTKDGEEIPALPAPQKAGGCATVAAASAEDLVILGLEPYALTPRTGR